MKAKQFTQAMIGLFFCTISACTSGDNMKSSSENGVKMLKMSNQDDFISDSDFEIFYNKYFINAINQKEESKLEALINPELGFFLAYKPTSYPIINRFNSIAELLESNPSFFDPMNKLVLAEKSSPPNFINCDFFSKEGCFFQENKKLNLISNIIRSAETQKELVLPDNDKNKAIFLERDIKITLVSTKNFVEYSFAYINGKWVLALIDYTKYDCL